MWQYAIPALVSAGSSLLGGFMKNKEEEAARAQQMQMFREQQAFQEKQFAQSTQQWEKNFAFTEAQAKQQLENLYRSEALQREFAQSGVQWRVQDAIKAGLHPLAAMGAGGAAFSPGSISVGSPPSPGGVGGISAPNISAKSGMAQGLASMGQDLSRAMMASAAQETRERMFNETMQIMTAQKAAATNDLIASQAQRIKQGSGPPGPALGTATEAPVDMKVGERGRNVIGGVEVRTHPGFTQTEKITDEYGEGVGDWAYGPLKVLMDWMYHNSGATSVAEYRRNIEKSKASQRGMVPLGRR